VTLGSLIVETNVTLCHLLVDQSALLALHASTQLDIHAMMDTERSRRDGRPLHSPS